MLEDAIGDGLFGVFLQPRTLTILQEMQASAEKLKPFEDGRSWGKPFPLYWVTWPGQSDVGGGSTDIFLVRWEIRDFTHPYCFF